MHLHCEFSLVELGSTSLGCMKVVLWLSNALAPASTPAFSEIPCAAIAACKKSLKRVTQSAGEASLVL
jgi:hypothetical protein